MNVAEEVLLIALRIIVNHAVFNVEGHHSKFKDKVSTKFLFLAEAEESNFGKIFCEGFCLSFLFHIFLTKIFYLARDRFFDFIDE